jgi:hypothetical protein
MQAKCRQDLDSRYCDFPYLRSGYAALIRKSLLFVIRVSHEKY